MIFSTASFVVAQNTAQAIINSIVIGTRKHFPCYDVFMLQNIKKYMTC